MPFAARRPGAVVLAGAIRVGRAIVAARQGRGFGTGFGAWRRSARATAAGCTGAGDHAADDATFHFGFAVAAGVHAEIREGHVDDGHQETGYGEHHGVDQLPGAPGQVQFGDDHPGLDAAVIARVPGADGEVQLLEHGAVEVRRVPAALDVREYARVRVRPGDRLRLDGLVPAHQQRPPVPGVQFLGPVPVHRVVDKYLHALVYLARAALPARRPAVRLRTVGRALAQLRVRGHARDRLLVELHEYRGDGRLNEERHQEQEHEQRHDAQQYEERCQIEQHLLPELFAPLPLRLFFLLIIYAGHLVRLLVIHQLILTLVRTFVEPASGLSRSRERDYGEQTNVECSPSFISRDDVFALTLLISIYKNIEHTFHGNE